jgi:hypothetical protein
MAPSLHLAAMRLPEQAVAVLREDVDVSKVSRAAPAARAH